MKPKRYFDKKVEKNFPISNWAIENQKTVWVLLISFIIAGLWAYFTMPRESFPEIIENKIYISSIFPGNSAEDVEKLITKKLEDEIKNISGVTKVTSNSMTDYSMIMVELDEDFTLQESKLKVKDKVDIVVGKNEWPTLDNGAKVDPYVFDLNLAEEFPILNINISGNYNRQKLKKFAEILEERIESLPEIKSADIRGVNDLEVEVEVDIFKMGAAKVSFNDIANAIRQENMTISGGRIEENGFATNLRIVGEIKSPSELNDVVVKTQNGTVFLRDIAEVKFHEKSATTFARSFGEPVVTMEVKKRSGTNMIQVVEQIKSIIEQTKKNDFPSDIEVTLANDQSIRTVNQVDDLVNNIIFGILLVVGVLQFFMGFRNSLFVGFAIPVSMLISFFILQRMGITMNTIVLFALVMGLGMLVDNGVVVVDNILSLLERGKSLIAAAKQGIGEVAWPIIASTATTLAAFFPLGLWPGIMGKFMIYFPMTLSIVLGASLFVALVFNASFSSSFMALTDKDKRIPRKRVIRNSAIGGFIGILFWVMGFSTSSKFLISLGSLGLLFAVFSWLYYLFLEPASIKFQFRTIPAIEKRYKRFLYFALTKKKPLLFFWGTIAVLFLSFVLVGVRQPKVLFFPDNEANQCFVYVEYPQGTTIQKTDSISQIIEKRLLRLLNRFTYIKDGKPYNYMMESFVAQVGEGSLNPRKDAGSQAETPYKSRITITFRQIRDRIDGNGKKVSSNDVVELIRKDLKDIAGPIITVEKDEAGPPRGYPINIELYGENYDDMLKEAGRMVNFINSLNIQGIDQLQLDVNKQLPETRLVIDRELAGSMNIHTQMVGGTLRSSLYGLEASTYKLGKDEYKINIRAKDDQKFNRDALLNQPVTFRNQSNGQLVQVPIPAFAKINEANTFNVIKRKNYKRVITIFSNIKKGANANAIVQAIKEKLEMDYTLPPGMEYKFAGEQEEQQKNSDFLVKALLIALASITFIIVLQFNSITKAVIVMISVLLSFSGVFLGIAITGRPFVIIMTMMGIISLAGVVVNNAIVLVDYFNLLVQAKLKQHGLEHEKDLSMKQIQKIIIDTGRSRLRPVLLTAITTILGLIPLAIGLNIDFISLISEFDPKMFVGGDNVIFWGPLAWTVIHGLTFATFLTLVVVPVMLYLRHRWKYGRYLKKKTEASVSY